MNLTYLVTKHQKTDSENLVKICGSKHDVICNKYAAHQKLTGFLLEKRNRGRAEGIIGHCFYSFFFVFVVVENVRGATTF